jgi:hypothetical protein
VPTSFAKNSYGRASWGSDSGDSTAEGFDCGGIRWRDTTLDGKAIPDGAHFDSRGLTPDGASYGRWRARGEDCIRADYSCYVGVGSSGRK